MRFGLIARHFDALEVADTRIKELVSTPFDTRALATFEKEWCGGDLFDLYAFCPVIDSIQELLESLLLKYDLDGSEAYGFLMSAEDADAATQCFNFLSFLFENCKNSTIAPSFMFYLETRPHLFALAANLNVVTASSTFGVKLMDDYIFDHRTMYQDTFDLISRDNFIPIYDSKHRGGSDYLHYLTSIASSSTIEPFTIGDFAPTDKQLSTLSSLELIAEGIKLLPRNLWADLIYECRKVEAYKPNNLATRIELVKAHIALSLFADKQNTAYSRNSRLLRYPDVLDPQLLGQFPELIDSAISTIRRPLDNESLARQRVTLIIQIQNEELFSFALRQAHAEFVSSITKFYESCPKTVRTPARVVLEIFSPTSTLLAMQQLQAFNREHKNLALQEAICYAFVVALKLGDNTFSIYGSHNVVIHEFISMLANQLNYGSSLDVRVAKGLLKISTLLITQESAIALASDTVTLNTLAAAMKLEPLQPLAIKALVDILDGDLLCYSYVGGLWSKFATVSDPLALVTLYSVLVKSDHGKEILIKRELTPKLYETVFSYNIGPHYYSELYYSRVTDAITATPGVLEYFSSCVTTYVNDTLAALDNAKDEHSYDLYGRLFYRNSSNEKTVNHFIWLLASLVHRESVREQLLAPEFFESLIKILSHPKLPFSFGSHLASSGNLATLVQEIAITKNLELVLCTLIELICKNLKSGNISAASAAISCVTALSFKGPNQLRDTVVPNLLESEHFNEICRILPGAFLDLCYKEADYLSGDHAAIVECFWSGPHEVIQGQSTSIDQFNSARFQYTEAAARKNLNVSQDEFDSIRADARLVRNLRDNLSQFMRQLEEFLVIAAKGKDVAPIPAKKCLDLLVSSYVSSMTSIPMQTVQDRYSFVVFSDSALSRAAAFIPCGGIKAIVDQHVKLSSAPDDGKVLKCYLYKYSDYKRDCEEALRNLLASLKTYYCTDPIHETLNAVSCQGKGISSVYEGIGYLFEKIAETHAPFLAEFNDMFMDEDHNLTAFIKVRDFALENYAEILKNQSLDLTLECAKFLAIILARFDRHSPVLDKAIPLLLARPDAPSLALLGALLDREVRVDGDFSTVVPQLESSNPTLVMAAAQVLRHSPTIKGIDLISIILKQREPKVILVLLELLVSSLLHGVISPQDARIDTLTNHCFTVFEEKNFDHSSIVCLVSLMDTTCCYTEFDSTILEMVMARLIALRFGKDSKTLNITDIEASCFAFAGRSQESLQASLERYYVLDSECLEIYKNRFISELYDKDTVQTKELEPMTTKICDLMLDNYIKGVDELLEASVAYVKARVTLLRFRNRCALVEDLVWESEKMTQLTEAYREAWDKFRKPYLKSRFYVEALTRVTIDYSSATDYILARHNFQEFVAASVKYAAAIGITEDHSGCWNAYISHQFQRNLLFWPLVNILASSNNKAIKSVLSCFEQILESATDGRLTTFGVLTILQIQGLDTIDLLPKLNDTRVMELCEKHIDFRKTPESIFGTEQLMFELSDKLNGEFSQVRRRHENAMAKFAPLNDAKKENEGTEQENETRVADDAASNTVLAGQDHDISDEEMAEEQDDEGGEADAENEEAANLGESDYYSDYSDDESAESEFEFKYPSGWPMEIIDGPFDEGEYKSFVIDDKSRYTIWGFNPSRTRNNEDKTFEDQSFDLTQKVTPIYLWRPEDSKELQSRGADLKPGMRPSDMASVAEHKYPWCPIHNYAWATYGREDNMISSQEMTQASHLTRHWSILRGKNVEIDWSKLKKLDRAKLNLPEDVNNNTNPADQGADCAQDSQDFVQDFAIRKACELLDNREMLPSWGIDTAELDAIPEELQLEVLVSWLTANAGEEMTPQDVLATFNDEQLVLDVCDSINTGKVGLSSSSLPASLKLGSKAQLGASSSIASELERLHLEGHQPLRPSWSENLHLNFAYYLKEDYVRYPSNATEKHLNEALLKFLLNNFSGLSVRSFSMTLSFLSKTPAGSLNTIQLLEIIDSPLVVRVSGNFSEITNAIKAHTKALPNGRPLQSHVIDKILAAFYTRSLLSHLRRDFMDLVQVLVEKKYLSKSRLRTHVYADILAQLDKCMSIKSGFIDAKAFNDFEATLSILSTHKICDLNKNNDVLVEKAIELGSEVSKHISEKDTSSIKLLKCYLLLVGMASDARPAFVKFVDGNRALVNRITRKDKGLLQSCANNLKGHYDLLDYAVKVELIRYFAPALGRPTNIDIHRDNIVEDTLRHLKDKDFKNQLRVKFVNELGFDDGGLTREWLTLFGRELADSDLGLFTKIVDGNHFTLHPNPQSLLEPSNRDNYEVIGKLMAKSILTRNSLDCQFSSIVYKAVVTEGELKLTIDDVQEFDQQLASSLKWMGENDITGVIMETFTTSSLVFGEIRSIELKPGGKEIQVTEENKLEYIDFKIQHLHNSVKNQLEAICKGFRSLIPLSIIRVFSAAELKTLLCGSHELNVAEWRANTSYISYTSESAPVKLFWQAADAMSNDERRQLLMFVTGSDSVSSLGFSSDSSGTKFVIGRNSNSNLPTASTCLSTLFLPPYTTYEDMRVNLSKAIELSGKGFGLV